MYAKFYITQNFKFYNVGQNVNKLTTLKRTVVKHLAFEDFPLKCSFMFVFCFFLSTKFKQIFYFHTILSGCFQGIQKKKI